jgi:hypothetical protein
MEVLVASPKRIKFPAKGEEVKAAPRQGDKCLHSGAKREAVPPNCKGVNDEDRFLGDENTTAEVDAVAAVLSKRSSPFCVVEIHLLVVGSRQITSLTFWAFCLKTILHRGNEDEMRSLQVIIVNFNQTPFLSKVKTPLIVEISLLEYSVMLNHPVDVTVSLWTRHWSRLFSLHQLIVYFRWRL